MPLARQGPLTDMQAVHASNVVMVGYERAAGPANLGFWEWDEIADRCTYCSERMASLHGVTVDEYLRLANSGKPYSRWIHEDDRARYEQGIRDFRADPREFVIDYRFLRADGQTIEVREAIAPVFGDDGSVVRTMGFVQDISEQRRSSADLVRARSELEARVQRHTAELERIDDELRESQARLQEAASITKLGHLTWRLDRAGGFQADREIVRILGLAQSPSGMYRREDFLERVHIDDRDEFDAAHRLVCTSPDTIELEYRIVRPDGEIRHVRELSKPRFGETNVAHSLFGTLQDVTERMNMSRRLQHSEQLFHEFGAQANEVYWVASADLQQVHYVSPSFERVFGISIDVIRANPGAWVDLVHADDLDSVQQQVESKRNNKTTRANFDVFRIVRPDGGIRWLRCRVYKIFDSNGEVLRYTGFAEDVTEYKTAEEELLQARKLDAIGKLTGGVAHDFNNLLTVMLGNAGLLRGRVSEEDSALVDDIVTAGCQGAELTRRLLAFSRQQAIVPIVTNVDELIADTLVLLRRSLVSKITIDAQLHASTASVMVDRALLQNALLNLALNAADAMPDGGLLEIRTQLARVPADKVEQAGSTPQAVVISMTDDGIGMSDRILAQAVEPFFTTKTAGQGSGMGLPMVYGFVNQSHGTFSIDSEVGTGTTVTIKLPRIETRPAPSA